MLTPDSYMKNKKGIYVPIRKGKGFCPNPVARDGIPYHADSEGNPSAVGSKSYDDYWDEQFDRCINGYETGGIFIPGRYYYYLNFHVLKGLHGVMYPWITDLDLEYFLTIEWIKKWKKAGLIALKARRKGLSEDFSDIVNHGMRFIDGYRAGIAGGMKTYVDGLRKKLVFGFDNVIPEMRLNYINSNEEILQTGYHEKTETGSYALKGYAGNVQYATMHDKAEKMEGEYFHDIAYEEAGQFPKLTEAYDSILPTLQFGAKMEGTVYIYGTAGNILNTSKGFQFLYQHNEEYDLVKMWIPGRRKFYPFMINSYSGEPINPKSSNVEVEFDLDTKEEIDPIKNLRKYTVEERIGMEDVESAAEYIKKQKIRLSKLPDKRALIKFNKSYPETEEEAWSSGGNNNFDPELLNMQVVFLMQNEMQIKQYVLDWVYKKNKYGKIEKVMPLKVTARVARGNDPKYKIHYAFQEPILEYKDLDVGGIDSYNQDLALATKSLGAMTIIRRYNNLPGYKGNYPGEVPVYLYYQRPKRKELFFEETLKAAVWYGLLRNTMVSAEYDNIINYWRNNGGERYLSYRPRAFESKSSKQEHKYGAKMTLHSKPLALGIAQSWIMDNCEYIYYPELVRDFLAYDEETVDSDWDAADSTMLALMRIEDMRRFPRVRNEDGEYVSSLPSYYYDEEGNIRVENTQKISMEDIKDREEKNYITSNDTDDDFQENDVFDYLDE